MTISLVQGAAQGHAQIASGTFTVNLTQSPTQGNALILCYHGSATDSNPEVTGISQTGVTWIKSNATKIPFKMRSWLSTIRRRRRLHHRKHRQRGGTPTQPY